MFSGLFVQFSLPADWFRDQWRICQTAEWNCRKVSTGRQNQGTKNTHNIHRVHVQTRGVFVTCFIYCRFNTLMCVCNKLFFRTLMFSSWTMCLSSSWSQVNKPGEKTLNAHQSWEKCVHAPAAADVFWLVTWQTAVFQGVVGPLWLNSGKDGGERFVFSFEHRWVCREMTRSAVLLQPLWGFSQGLVPEYDCDQCKVGWLLRQRSRFKQTNEYECASTPTLLTPIKINHLFIKQNEGWTWSHHRRFPFVL